MHILYYLLAITEYVSAGTGVTQNLFLFRPPRNIPPCALVYRAHCAWYVHNYIY